MRTRFRPGMSCLAASLALLTYAAQGGSVTYDFDTDPVGVLEIRGNDAQNVPWDPASGQPRWQAKDGNPATGGFLALCYATDYFDTHVLFPDLDPGKVVTAFHFECDLRVGNSQGDRGADGFSINFARSYDPVIEHWEDAAPGRGYRGDTISGPCSGCESLPLPETGTRTGIAISFDTWAGNTLNDGADLEGIIVAVDGVTVAQSDGTRGFPLPTRHGACADNTSLQTGPRDTDFWASAGDIYTPEAWDTLCWQRFIVDLDDTGKLTVIWKGRTLLDKYQTAYFPTPGRLIFGGRTGGENEVTHVDNIVLTTTAVVLDTNPPSVPGNLRATVAGARGVTLTWDASVDAPDPALRVAYNVFRDGALIRSALTDTTYRDAPGPSPDKGAQLLPGSTHSYEVKAVDLSANESAAATLSVTMAAETAVPGYFTGQVYTNVTGTVVQDWFWNDPNFPSSPGKEAWWLSGLSFGDQTSFGNTLGETFGFRFAGTLTAPKTGQYRFFIRSDDASEFYLNTTTAIPDPVGGSQPIAVETDCCDAFLEPGVANDDGSTYATSDPVSLTAGQKYGFLWLVKEGTGGDYGRVAWRMEGDTTPAANLPAIHGAFVTPATGAAVSDAGGASVTITQNLQDVTAGANEHLTLTVAATAVSPWGYPTAYQWFKDGAPIMNANAASYYIDVLSAADAGKYKALVSVPGASAESAEMTLTVNADVTKPTIGVADVHGSLDLTHVRVTFSEPVTSPTATTAANYSIAPALAVSAATRVSLYTIELTTGVQAPNTKYTLTVNNVADNAGNVIAANTKVDWMSWVVVGTVGPITFEIYDGAGGATAGTITGTTVADLTAYAGYPASPDVTQTITAFNSRLVYADDTHENYGARMTGLITPTESGNYRFFITSDDSSELWLSTDATEAKLVKIAEETGCCNAFTEPSSPRTSAPIALVGGTSYLLRGIYKEGGGGDYMQVAWRKEGNPQPASALQPIPGTFDPWAGAPLVTAQPVSVAVDPGGTATFSVVADLGARSLTYQWQRGWNDLAGETGPSLTIANVDASKLGDYKVLVSNSAGSATSNPAILALKQQFTIEAEDFDYDSGKHVAVADTMPYTGMAYDGLSAKYNVDYHNDNNDSITYRRGGDLAVAGQGASMDNATGNYLSLDRGAWTVSNNYKIGWIGAPDWHNYTRAIPAGDYTAYAALSYDGSGAGQLKATLSKVTAGVGTANQTLQELGLFDWPGSRGWGRNNLVPLKDAGGAMAVFNITDPTTTLRMSHTSGDFDWLVLVPTEGGAVGPRFTSIQRNTDGTITIEWTGGGTLEAAPTVQGPWEAVPGATSPFTLTPDQTMLFGRIRQ